MFLRMLKLSFLMMVGLMAGCATTPTVDSGTVTIENKDMSAVIVFSDNDRGKILRTFWGRGTRSGHDILALRTFLGVAPIPWHYELS